MYIKNEFEGDLTTSDLETLLKMKIIPDYVYNSHNNNYTIPKYPTDLGEYIDKNKIKSHDELKEKLGFDISKRIDPMITELHENDILHGDLHTKNIVINPDTKDVRIIDFAYCSSISRMTKRDMKDRIDFWNTYEETKITKDKLLGHEKRMWTIGYFD